MGVVIQKLKSVQTTSLQVIGVLGALACIVLFIRHPSFPTPDKLMVFLTFIFMAFHQTKEMLKRLLPFTIIILIYESFRSLANTLNTHTNYTLAPHIDRWLGFGQLPGARLQHWLWHGYVQWYDIVLYIPYMLFFAMPFALAILIWKTRDHYFWQGVTAYSVLFFSAFATFLAFPAAPPWLAAQQHVIQPITRISTNVWGALGIQNFPSVYNHLSPNPVAAVPSLHAAASTLFSLIIFKLYGRRWGLVSLLYPGLIYIGVVYEGEHYLFDVIAGVIYGVVAYLAAPWVLEKISYYSKNLMALIGKQQKKKPV